MTTTDRQAKADSRGSGVADRPVRFPERVLWKLWKKRAALQDGLRTEAGRRVRVLYPGRPGTSAGPDFRDAIMEIEGVGLVRGDVEIHLRQRDWAAHGHSHDPNYNGVVVHAAFQVDTAETQLQNGGRVPMVSLESLLPSSPGPERWPENWSEGSSGPLNLWALVAQHGFLLPDTPQEAGELLDRAGDQRFLSKAAAFRRFLEGQEPEQTLYEALMEGLGYRHNRQPFLRLAYLAPYSALRRAARSLPDSQRGQIIASWLLAISGLEVSAVPSPRPRGLRRSMNKAQWHLFRVRPSNHPAVRIGGAGELLSRYLVPGLINGLSEAAKPGVPKALISALAVKTPGQPASIGGGRAKDLAVNAVLPFLYAHYSGGDQEPGPGQDYLALFQKFPKLEGNEVEREMAAELLPLRWQYQVDSARRQQGLLHLASLLRGAS